MPDVLWRCWLYSAHWQRCVVAVLCSLPADFEASEPVQGPLLFLTIIVVAVLARPGIPRCWGWVPGFVHRLCLCGIMVELVMVHYGSQALDYCQWMAQAQLMRVSVGIMMVVHTVVFPALPRN